MVLSLISWLIVFDFGFAGPICGTFWVKVVPNWKDGDNYLLEWKTQETDVDWRSDYYALYSANAFFPITHRNYCRVRSKQCLCSVLSVLWGRRHRRHCHSTFATNANKTPLTSDFGRIGNNTFANWIEVLRIHSCLQFTIVDAYIRCYMHSQYYNVRRCAVNMFTYVCAACNIASIAQYWTTTMAIIIDTGRRCRGVHSLTILYSACSYTYLWDK